MYLFNILIKFKLPRKYVSWLFIKNNILMKIQIQILLLDKLRYVIRIFNVRRQS